MKLIDFLDDFLNGFTMYRLLVYGLLLLAAVAGVMSLTGSLQLPIKGLGLSFVIVLVVSYIAHRLLALIWRAVPNQESWLLTALILFFILPPVTSPAKALGVAGAALVAIASKYLISRHNKHVVNPAAFGAALGGLVGFVHATWWVGGNSLWPAALIIGLLIVRKIRRFTLVLCFVAAALVTAMVQASQQHQLSAALLHSVVLTSPLIFLGTIMLTEPITMPVKKLHQILFALGIGVLYVSHLQLPGVYVYPETALVIGNLFAYLVVPKYNWHVELARVEVLSERVYNYVFRSAGPLEFLPGQYMEWTLPGVPFDGRGNRRTFTIASSPTEPEVMMGVKFYEPSSNYKQTLRQLRPGAIVATGHIAGTFTMPKDTSQKLLFVAGGVGITPFRSMLKYVIDQQEHRDIVLFYAVSDPTELVYKDVLRQAAEQGVRIVPVATNAPADWSGLQGPITSEMVAHYVPDLAERKVYISGPEAMVTHTRRIMKHGGAHKVVTDYFSGY